MTHATPTEHARRSRPEWLDVAAFAAVMVTFGLIIGTFATGLWWTSVIEPGLPGCVSP